MNYKKMAQDYYRCRYFFTTEEYFNKKNITDANIKKLIKLEILEIQREEKEIEKLIDALLKSSRAFKFSESDNSKNFMIYHPCSKELGFQLSFFYNNEPISDIIRETIKDIKVEIIQYTKKYNLLIETVGKLY